MYKPLVEKREQNGKRVERRDEGDGLHRPPPVVGQGAAGRREAGPSGQRTGAVQREASDLVHCHPLRRRRHRSQQLSITTATRRSPRIHAQHVDLIKIKLFY